MASWTFPVDLLKKIPPQQYLHVLDNNTNVVRLEIGPQTYRCKDQETAIYGPAKMVVVPPHHYVVVSNPVATREINGKREVLFDKFNQAILRHGEQEVRFEQEPFPLYPGEILVDKIKPLEIVEANSALLLEASRDFEDRYEKDEDGKPIQRLCGTRWYFKGPGTYIPQPEIIRKDVVRATVVKPGQALRIRARKTFVDKKGTRREAGCLWHHTEEGFFLPSLEEEIIKVDQPYILTSKSALHLRASYNFVDSFGVERRAGAEWLVTNEMSESHIPHVYSTVVGTVNITTLGKREWLLLQNPTEGGRLVYGERVVVRGEKNFFLQPGEVIVKGPQEVEVLTGETALLVSAQKDFVEPSGRHRKAGEKWLIYGPKEYWPPVNVQVLRRVPAVIQIGSFAYFKPDAIFLSILSVLAVLYTLWKLLL